MTFDWHMLYPLHTAILDNSQVFGGVPCKAQLCNFSNWFFSPRFGVVPIWELWQFCYVRIGPPKTSATNVTSPNSFDWTGNKQTSEASCGPPCTHWRDTGGEGQRSSARTAF